MRAAVLLLLCAACKGEAEPAAPDAGPPARSIGVPELGVHLMLPMGWVEDPVESSPTSSHENAPSVITREVRTVAQARRVAQSRPFLVAPRIAITVEPTARRIPQEVFDQTLSDLKKLDSAENVGLTRTAMSSRFVGRDQVGDIELAYFVRSGAKPREVIMRSLIVLRSPPEGSRAIVTINATYLAEDAELVSSEVQAIMNSLRLEGAMSVE